MRFRRICRAACPQAALCLQTLDTAVAQLSRASRTSRVPGSLVGLVEQLARKAPLTNIHRIMRERSIPGAARVTLSSVRVGASVNRWGAIGLA